MAETSHSEPSATCRSREAANERQLRFRLNGKVRLGAAHRHSETLPLNAKAKTRGQELSRGMSLFRVRITAELNLTKIL